MIMAGEATTVTGGPTTVTLAKSQLSFFLIKLEAFNLQFY